MKKLFLLLFLVFFCGFAVCSQNIAYAEGEGVEEYINAYLAYNQCSDMQEYLDGARSGAGLDAAFVLRRYRDGLDFSTVRDGIDLEEKVSASTHEKRVFYANAFGKEVSGSKDDVYELGLMSMVFGLHLLKNGIIIEGVEIEELVEEILSRQREDGGWSLFVVSDVDVTAMCLQALADVCEDQRMDQAIGFLSSQQALNGTFSSMGTYNCQSTAQVVIALSALKIDADSDERFVKEKSALGGLLSFATDEKLFSREIDGSMTESATVQALSALVSYKLYKEKGEAFYSLPSYAFGQRKGTIKEEEKITKKDVLPVNAWVAIGIAGAAVLVCAILLLTKKGGIKEVVVIIIVGCGLSLFVGLSTFQSVDEYYADVGYEGETISVFVSIRKDTVNKEDPIIFEGDVNVKENATVLDAVILVTKQNRLQLSYVPGYISSIDSLAEFSYGNESGWMFAVNGEFSNKSCSEKTLKEGDELYFLYSTNMGKDVADFFEVDR